MHAARTQIVTVTMNPAIDLTCSVPGFSAGEVNRVAQYRMDAAGKGVNIAGLLRMFDLPVTATGFLGDGNAGIFERYFSQRRIIDDFIRVPGETRIGIKVLNPENQSTTDINFPGLPPGADALLKLKNSVAELAEQAAIVVIAGSLPAEVPPHLVGELVSIVKSNGAKAVVDTSGQALKSAVEATPWMVKPNDTELGELMGHPVNSMDEMAAEARNLNKQGVAMVAVSLGSQGAIFVEQDSELIVRPPRVEAVSTVGAGDAMIGGLVAGMAMGLPREENIRMATALSAATVAQPGPSLENLDKANALKSQVKISQL